MSFSGVLILWIWQPEPAIKSSQASEATVCGLGRLEALNSFLSLSNMSPVKEKRIPYMESSEKTKSKCVTKALQCIAAICETICPGEGQVLQENVKTLISKEVRETEKVI